MTQQPTLYTASPPDPDTMREQHEGGVLVRFSGWQFHHDLSDRDRKEIDFARLYEADFGHGTDGHNRLLIIAKMARLLDYLEKNVGRAAVAEGEQPA